MSGAPKKSEAAVQKLAVSTYTIPTDLPESDGTIEWDAGPGRARGRRDARPRLYLCRCAASSSAATRTPWPPPLLGGARARIDVYGSGGFTSYTLAQLQAQLGGWAERGIARVKMKIGRDPVPMPIRRVSKRRGGPSATRPHGGALRRVTRFVVRKAGSSDDLVGLRWMRSQVPHDMDVAAGEYGYDAQYFRHMLEEQAVDVLQADATRCTGITGFLGAAALADAFMLPLSAHCAPSMHAHVCCAVPRAVHLEYFHDPRGSSSCSSTARSLPSKARYSPILRAPVSDRS